MGFLRVSSLSVLMLWGKFATARNVLKSDSRAKPLRSAGPSFLFYRTMSQNTSHFCNDSLEKKLFKKQRTPKAPNLNPTEAVFTH